MNPNIQDNTPDHHKKWIESISMMLKQLRICQNLNQDEVEDQSRRQVQRDEDISGNMTLKKFFRACDSLNCHPLDVMEILR